MTQSINKVSNNIAKHIYDDILKKEGSWEKCIVFYCFDICFVMFWGFFMD